MEQTATATPRANSAFLLVYGYNIMHMDDTAAERCSSAWVESSSGANYRDWNVAYGAMFDALMQSGRTADARDAWRHIKLLIPGSVRLRNSLVSPIYNAARAIIVSDLIGQYGFTQAHFDIITGPAFKAGLLDPESELR